MTHGRGEEMSDNFELKQSSLGENLRRFRKEHGYTQKFLAEYLGFERTTYVKYETSRTPDLDSTIRLAALYGVSVDELIGNYPDEVVNKKELASYARASSPGSEDGSNLTRDELKLLALFRSSIRKNEILDYVRRISTEDSKMND